MTHIWKGKVVDSFKELLPQLDSEIESTMAERMNLEDLFRSCDQVSRKILEGHADDYIKALEADGAEHPDEVLNALASSLSSESLIEKLERELGTDNPFEIQRIDDRTQRYEAWKPLGVLVHITAGNSPIVTPMATIEGLLSGNINIVKSSSRIGEFALAVLKDICSVGNIGDFVYLLRFSSKDTDTMRYLLERADCVSAWGGEEAVSSIREMTPRNVPFIAWGHKISFGYIEPYKIDDGTMDMVAKSICRNEQQSCSSPQCVLIDTDDPEVVQKAAIALGKALDRAKPLYPRVAPDDAQAAEITAVTQIHKCDLYFNPGDAIEDPEGVWRILVCYQTKFMPSPLFRTVWMSPLPRKELISKLRGMRQYLQTAGLACDLNDLEEVSSALYAAGVARITPLDSMSASYTGEPHDGGYALPRFMKKVTMRMSMPMNGITSFCELRPPVEREFKGPIQTKKDYPPVPDNGTKVLMKSGGTTGEPVYCSYTAKDMENYIIRPTIRSLMAIGLDPATDVVADYLKAGNLYGGLNSFISIFDKLSIPHLNISGLDDLKLTAKYTIQGKATVVLGAPSYIVRMFRENEQTLKEYGRIKKVLYGGEMMTSSQRKYLTEEFGIEDIFSMVYGANETGSMGYQCRYCEGSVFHQFTDIQKMEIVKRDSDEPVEPGEVGRLLFTGFLRQNGHTERYDIGDLGREIPGECPCGRKEPRFELMGRHGDVVRIGGTFFNFHRIAAILTSEFGYKGLMQIILDSVGVGEKMTICVQDLDVPQDEVVSALVKDYDSFEKTVPTGLMELKIRNVRDDEFVMNTSSIKLRNIVDRRIK